MISKGLIKLVIYVTTGVFAICAILSFAYNVFPVLKIISLVTAISELLIALYFSILWRFFNFLKVPKIYGKYNVIIKYIDPKDNKPKTKQCFATIRQDLFSILISLATDERTSDTIACDLRKKDDVYYLYYVYKTTTKIEFLEFNPEQTGAVELCIFKNKLEGRYWTTSKTVGDIRFIKK